MKIKIKSEKVNKSIETSAAVVVALNRENETVDVYTLIEEAKASEVLEIVDSLRMAENRIVELAAEKALDILLEKAREL